MLIQKFVKINYFALYILSVVVNTPAKTCNVTHATPFQLGVTSSSMDRFDDDGLRGRFPMSSNAWVDRASGKEVVGVPQFKCCC